MSLSRSFSDPPFAYLASDKCRCRFSARIQMFADCLILIFVVLYILFNVKSKRRKNFHLFIRRSTTLASNDSIILSVLKYESDLNLELCWPGSS